MKLKSIFTGLCLLAVFLAYASFDLPSARYYGYTPIFMELPELRNSVSYTPGSRELKNPGKIYYKDSYIYVNEKYKGIHIINNTNPSKPIHEGYIAAPGCIDIAIKGSIVYLDNAIDLVAFDMDTKKEVSRVENVFPEPLSPNGQIYYGQASRNIVLVGWESNN